MGFHIIAGSFKVHIYEFMSQCHSYERLVVREAYNGLCKLGNHKSCELFHSTYKPLILISGNEKTCQTVYKKPLFWQVRISVPKMNKQPDGGFEMTISRLPFFICGSQEEGYAMSVLLFYEGHLSKKFWRTPSCLISALSKKV